ncbi:MAG: hypothetical protein ABJC39_02175 [Chloroflexota bacterium]
MSASPALGLVTAGIALLLVAAFVTAGRLIRPATRRTDLGLWHPAVIWLALEAIFFGFGSAILAINGRIGPALYVAGAVLAFSAAVAVSDAIAWRRTKGDEAEPRLAKPGTADAATEPEDGAPLRPLVVAVLAAVGVALLAPTLIRVGLPFLAEDITGARSEVAGLSVQVMRVTVPALALAMILAPRGTAEMPGATRQRLGWVVLGILVALDVVLASRYLVAELLAVALVGIGLAGWRLKTRRLAAIALIAVVAFGGIGILRAYDQAAGRELAFAFERTVNRIVLIQPRTLEALQSAIPAEQPYFGGLTWFRRLGPVVGRTDIPNLGYWIYARLFPGQDPPGYAAPGLIGEAWANFGPAGLALFAFLGLIADRLGDFLSRRRRATGDLIAGALLVVFLARTHALGLNGLAVLVALVIAWRVLAADGLAGAWAALRETLAWRV